MTDREKAVKDLEAVLEWLYQGEDRECSKAYRAVEDALELLKEPEENDSEWLEDSDPGQELGTAWACRACGRSLHLPFIWNPYEVNWKFCPWCGKGMKR